MKRRALFGSVLLVLLVLTARNAAEILVVRDPLPARADAIVILAGSPPDRALEAADLYATGIAERILVTREARLAELDVLAARGVRLPESSDVTVDLLIKLGVPLRAIEVLPRRTSSTLAEARVIASWACGRARSLVLVTSPSHTRRAGMIVRAALGPTVEVSVRPATMASFPTRSWWRHRRAAKAVALEWQKLLAYLLVDQWRLEPCRRPVSRR